MPLELRPLLNVPQVSIPEPGAALPHLNVEYAEAAPGLLSGVTQINVTLPDAFPAAAATGYPPGILPFLITVSGTSFFSGEVTISVLSN